MKIFVSLSGAPQVSAEQRKIKFATKKAEAIFYYLALNGRGMRSELELMFWPELDAVNANKNLRNSIYYINKAFGCDMFKKDKRTLEFSEEVELSCTADPLKGELLDGFYLKDCPDFDVFLEEYRKIQNLKLYDRCKEQFLQALNTEDLPAVISQYTALSHMNPYDENVALAVMEYFFQRQQIDDLIRVYKQTEKVLHDDLMIEPLKELQNLYKTALMQKKVRKNKADALFYGRTAELQKIELSHRNFSAGITHTNFVITGDVGCGKTCLLNHYLRSNTVEGTCHIPLICYEAEKHIQYKILSLLVHKMVNAAGIDPHSLPPECQPVFYHFLPIVFNHFVTGVHEPALDTGFTFYEVEEAFRSTFAYLAGKNRYFITIDDLQYCDGASLDFIQKFVFRQFGRQVFLVFCCRQYPAENCIQGFHIGEDSHSELLCLGNFSEHEVRQILSDQLLEEQASSFSSIYQESNGNPLYLFEIIHNLKTNASVSSYQFLSLLEGKTRLLSRQEQTVLHICSVFFGRIFPEAVASIMGVEVVRILELIDPLVQAGFLREELRGGALNLFFVHEQFRKYIYEKQPLITRKIFHVKIAEYLEHEAEARDRLPELVDDIIYHYRQGGQKVRYLEYRLKKAFGLISMNHDYPEFLTVLAQSFVDELEQEFAQADVPMKLKFEFMLFKASFAIKTCDYENGLKLANYILEHDTDRQRLLSAHKQLINYGIQTREYLLIRAHAVAALRLLKQLPENHLEKVDLLKSYALAEINQQHYANGKKTLLQCLELLRQEPVSEAVLYQKACVFNYLAYEYKYLGQYERCIPLYQKAIQICTSANIYIGLPLFYMNLGQSYMMLGDVNAARDCFLRFEDLNEKIHPSLATTVVKAYLARIYFDEGDYTRAFSYLSEAYRYSVRIKNPYEDAYLYKIICYIKQKCAQRPELLKMFNQLLPESQGFYAEQATRLFGQIGLEREIPDIFSEE